MRWTRDGVTHEALWISERGAPPPQRIEPVDDRMTANDAYGLAAQGVGLLWHGDYPNARQLLTAMDHRGARRAQAANHGQRPESFGEAFQLERQARAQRARTLGMLLVPINADLTLPLRRAQDVREAFLEAHPPLVGDGVIALREVLGLVGAHEWRRNGLEIAALGNRIHPHYGVFAPVRSEYVDLVSRTPLPDATKATSLAFDIGTGTGVLAAVLARRGIDRIVATEIAPRALVCACDNVQRLGLERRIEVVEADLFPPGRAALVVCNPPWVPARPSSPLEHGVYDFESRMLTGFLRGLAEHLVPGGEGWLILSDLAEHLGLRTRDWLEEQFALAGLAVVDRLDIRPRHPRANDPNEFLHDARKAEVISLWRLQAATAAG